MSYRSRVNIRISRTPPTDDDDIYPMMQEVYNALHILNANIDSAVDVLIPPEASKSPSESFGPRLNTFWAPAASNATRGRVVSMRSSGQFERGVSGYSSGDKRVTSPYGVVVEDAKDSKALIAWPPFVLDVDLSEAGANIGDIIYTDNTGGILRIEGGVESKYWPVAQVIDTNMVLFIPNMHT